MSEEDVEERQREEFKSWLREAETVCGLGWLKVFFETRLAEQAERARLRRQTETARVHHEVLKRRAQQLLDGLLKD